MKISQLRCAGSADAIYHHSRISQAVISTMATSDAKDASAPAAEAASSHRRSWSGFDKPGDYFSSLKSTPKLLAKRAAYIRSAEEQLKDKEQASGDMKQVLNWCHVMALGT